MFEIAFDISFHGKKETFREPNVISIIMCIRNKSIIKITCKKICRTTYLRK